MSAVRRVKGSVTDTLQFNLNIPDGVDRGAAVSAASKAAESAIIEALDKLKPKEKELWEVAMAANFLGGGWKGVADAVVAEHEKRQGRLGTNRPQARTLGRAAWNEGCKRHSSNEAHWDAIAGAVVAEYKNRGATVYDGLIELSGVLNRRHNGGLISTRVAIHASEWGALGEELRRDPARRSDWENGFVTVGLLGVTSL